MTENILSHGKFNLDALLSLSRVLRGQPCTCDVSQVPKTGSLNWVIFISFNDGVEWVFRSPRRGYHAIVDDKSAAKMLVSEAATLKYLRANTSIPVPQVYSYSGSWDNDIGVPYILMSKASGRSLSEYDWAQISRQTLGYPSLRPLLPLTDRGREKVISQLGAMMAQLSGIRFDKIGSIFEHPSEKYSVGECLSRSLLWQWRDSLDGISRGPFSEENQYLDSLVSVFTSHAMELPLTPHAFFAPIPDLSEYPNWPSFKAAVDRWNDFVAVGEKIENSRNRLSYCIAGQFLREMVPRVFTGGGDGFTLSHPDLHAGNIFVDDDLNITCVIDWGSTSTGPVSELLITPRLGSALLPLEAHTATFRSAFSQQFQLEPQVSYWEMADLMWCFSRLVRMLSIQDYTLFRVLYETVHKVEGVDIPRLFDDRAAQENNKQLLATLNEDDISEDIKKKEDAAFGSGKAAKTDIIAVARKLTLVSQINRGFLADKRLWRWIEVVFEQADSEYKTAFYSLSTLG